MAWCYSVWCYSVRAASSRHSWSYMHRACHACERFRVFSGLDNEKTAPPEWETNWAPSVAQHNTGLWVARCTVLLATACSEWRPQQGEALQQVWATRQATPIAELWSPVEPVGLQVLSVSSSFPGRKSQSASLSCTGPRACLVPWLQYTWKTTLGL